MSLLNEGRSIQHQLKSTRPKSFDTLARSFSKFMMKGKVQSAIRLICDKGNGKPLSLDDCVPDGTSHPRTVKEILHEKHPDTSPVVPSAILSLDTPSTDHEPHSVIFDQLDGPLIHKVANGATGPSGIDAAGWKHLPSSFKNHSADL